MFQNLLARRRRAEALQPDHHTLVAGPLTPTQGRRCLNRDAFLDTSWKHALPIRFRLALEKIPTRHADHARLHSVALQSLPRRYANTHFRPGADQYDVRRPTIGFRQYISAF